MKQVVSLQTTEISRRVENKFTLSVVIPIFNEASVIAMLFERLSAVLKPLPYKTEILFVDDGSSDGSAAAIAECFKVFISTRIIHLSRNFGHQAAVFVGTQYATGDAIVIIDADLQDPPEKIPEMVEKWKQGAEIVHAVRNDRSSDTFFKRTSAYIFYALIQRFSDETLVANSADYRLLDRGVAELVTSMPERRKYLRGLYSWVGLKTEKVYFRRDARVAGEAKYTLRKMLNLALNGFLSFSIAPLRLILYSGFVFLLLACLGILMIIFQRFILDDFETGLAGIYCLLLFILGVSQVSLGLVAEYLGNILENSQNRPVAIVSEVTVIK